ncbi:hypothetical protein ACFL4W_02370 [Planctomycetota bacterium]
MRAMLLGHYSLIGTFLALVLLMNPIEVIPFLIWFLILFVPSIVVLKKNKARLKVMKKECVVWKLTPSFCFSVGLGIFALSTILHIGLALFCGGVFEDGFLGLGFGLVLSTILLSLTPLVGIRYLLAKAKEIFELEHPGHD